MRSLAQSARNSPSWFSKSGYTPYRRFVILLRSNASFPVGIVSSATNSLPGRPVLPSTYTSLNVGLSNSNNILAQFNNRMSITTRSFSKISLRTSLIDDFDESEDIDKKAKRIQKGSSLSTDDKQDLILSPIRNAQTSSSVDMGPKAKQQGYNDIEPGERLAAMQAWKREDRPQSRSPPNGTILDNLLSGQISNACEIFERMVTRGSATIEDCNMMLMACHNSDEMRQMIDISMLRAGVMPNADSFNILISRLMVEGNRKAALFVAKEKMATSFVTPDDVTWATLNLSESNLRIMRTKLFLNLIKLEAIEDHSAVKAAAVETFHLLVPPSASEKTQAQQFLVLLSSLNGFDDLLRVRFFLDDCRNSIKSSPSSMVKFSGYILGSQLGLKDLDFKEAQYFVDKDDQEISSLQKVVEPSSYTHGDFSMEPRNVAPTSHPIERNTDMIDDFDYMEVARKIWRVDKIENPLLPDLPSVDLDPSVRHIEKLLKLLADKEESKNVESAWEFVDKLATSGEANAIHYNLMLKTCKSSAQIRHVIDMKMQSAGVKPTVFTYTTLVHRLVVEGDTSAARKVAEEEMPAAGIEPSSRIWKTLELSSEFRRTTRFELLPDMTWKALYLPAEDGEELSAFPDDLLNELIEDNAYQEAWALFYDSFVNGEVNVKDCNTMLKACYDSDHMRHLISVTMKKAGVAANVITYNTLIGRLMVEGNEVAAKGVVDEFLSTEEIYAPVVNLLGDSLGADKERSHDEEQVPVPGGLLPNNRTKEALELSGKALSRFRTKLLQQLLGQGRNGATFAAWSLFDKLVQSGQVDVYQFNVMLKACVNSQYQRQLINITMKNAEVKPSLVTYTTLVHQLMMEGLEKEARLVVHQEMPAANLVPDERAKKLLNSSAIDLHLMRQAANVGNADQRPEMSGEIRNAIRQGQLERAREIFAERVSTREVHVNECNVMINLCHNSEQMYDFINVSMEEADVRPNVETYLHLVRMLKVENKGEEARKVVEEDMAMANVVSDQRVWELIYMPSHEFNSQRVRKLEHLLSSGDDASIEAAMQLFNHLVQSGSSTAHQTGVVLKDGCFNSTEIREILEVAIDSGVKPNVTLYTTLISMLMIEGDQIGAQEVLNEDMLSAGIEPNQKTHDTINIEALRLTKMRSAKLIRWINNGGALSLCAAWDLLRKLVERKQAHKQHFVLMIKACKDVEDLDQLLQLMMVRSIIPEMAFWKAVLRQMVALGGDKRADDIVTRGIPKLGLMPTPGQTKTFQGIIEAAKRREMRRRSN